MASEYALNLFPETPQGLENLEGEDYLRAIVRNALRYLWENWNDEDFKKRLLDIGFLDTIRDKKNTLPLLFKTLFVERSPHVMRAARLEIQRVLFDFQDQLTANPPESEEDLLKVNLSIQNFLSIYAMFSPNAYETIQVPQLIRGQWELIEYEIEPIELTPRRGPAVNFMNDTDRLFSYGLTPTNNIAAKRILLHCGTGWPTAQGSTMQVFVDLWPGKTPGETFFEGSGKDEINAWLDKPCASDVIVSGQSLGGSLAYLTAMHRPDKISEAYCLVPPGMDHDYDANHALFGAWERMAEKDRPTVYIQKQASDPVSKMGTFKEDFILLKTRLTQSKQSGSKVLKALRAHACSYASCEGVEIEQCDVAEENASDVRRWNNRVLYHRLRAIVFWGIMAPYVGFIRPLWQKYAVPNWSVIVLSGLITSVLAVLTFASGVILPVIGTSVGMMFAAGYAAGFLVDKLLNLFTIDSYVRELRSMPFAHATFKVMFDAMNILTLGGIGIGFQVLKDIHSLWNFNHARFPDKAKIHEAAYARAHRDLNHYVKPNFILRLNCYMLLGMYCVVVVPLKFFLYDLPVKILGILIYSGKSVYHTVVGGSSNPDNAETMDKVLATDIVVQTKQRAPVSQTQAADASDVSGPSDTGTFNSAVDEVDDDIEAQLAVAAN